MKPLGFFFEYVCYNIRVVIFIGITWCLTTGCGNKNKVVKAQFKPLIPHYQEVQLLPQNDTINFTLAEHTSNRIESFNMFNQDRKAYVSFYDRGSKCILIYDFYSGVLITQTYLKQWIKSDKLDKATVYVKNFDSVYIATRTKMFLLDSAGTLKNKMEFSERSGNTPLFTNTCPAVFKDGFIYVGVKPFINESSIKVQQDFKALYRLDIENKKKERFYHFPPIYQEDLYGYSFHAYSYCVNNKGNFVFSFAADTNVYETNLSDYHIAYLGRSKYQSKGITPITKNEAETGDSFKSYSLQDSYEAIFFDPYRKRYIRQAKLKISESEFNNSATKKRTAIIFDENFQIIGESEVNGRYAIESIVFTEDGRIYARTNTEDTHGIHFVRLAYEDNNDKSNANVLTHRVVKSTQN